MSAFAAYVDQLNAVQHSVVQTWARVAPGYQERDRSTFEIGQAQLSDALHRAAEQLSELGERHRALLEAMSR
jgi:hypothetical protein